MRTTVDIPDDLYQQAASTAASEGIPVGNLIARALRVALDRTPPAGRGRVDFPLHHSSNPGVLSTEQVKKAAEDAFQQEDISRAGPM